MRRVAPTVEPNSQLGQVIIGITPHAEVLVNSSGRALIKTGQSCGISVPLTSILYGTAGTVVQVIRRGRVETRRVEAGLMSAGQVEIKDGLVEGDIVVARAGALLREGDPVRPVTARGCEVGTCVIPRAIDARSRGSEPSSPLAALSTLWRIRSHEFS